MTNKQIIILEKIKSLLKSKGFVGVFPDDVQNIGQNFPAFLIQDGDEEYKTKTGGRIEYTYYISVMLYSNVIGQKSILDAQTEVLDALLDDQTLGGTCVLIEPLSVEKGEYSDTMNWYNVGIYKNVKIRKINLQVVVYDER